MLIVLFFAILLVAALSDVKYREVKDRYWIMIVILALVRMIFVKEIPLWDHLSGAVIISVPMLILTMLISGAFGGGDIKLVFACGLFFGLRVMIVAMAVAILTAGVYIGIRFAVNCRSKKEAFAFVPFLYVGMVVGTLFWKQVIDWYLGTLL